MGGSPSIPQRDLSGELSTLFKSGWPQEHQALNQWWQSEPLLSQSHDFALNNMANIGALTGPLQGLMGEVPGQFADYQKQLGGYSKELGGYNKELGALKPQLAGLVNSQQDVYSSLLPILNSMGALTPEQERNSDQSTRAAYAARGNVMGNQAVGAELLNRDQYRQQRFASTLGQALGLSGSIGGLTAEQAGLIGQQAGITGQQAGITGQQAGLTGAQAGLETGLASGIQGLQQGVLNQTLGTEQSQVGTFATLINPLLSFASNLGESNQNAAAAQSIAGANKSSGAMGGGMQAIGSIATAVLPLLFASDERIKDDIVDTGRRTKKGTPIKRWRYKGRPQVFEGPIAQELEVLEPERVLTEPWSGLKRVVGRLIEIPTLTGLSLEQAAA